MAAPQPPQAGRAVPPHARAMAAAQQAALSPFTTQRIALYGTASTFAALGVIARAFRQRSNFYAATVWLARSNGSMLILLNFAIFMTFIFGKIVQAIFFGQLRSIEVEHLYERSWYAVTETLLAMTIFRDEFDSSFVLLFGTLLFLKVFHWLCSDRVELMEQSQTVSRLFHARMISVLSTLLCLDFFLVAFTIEVLLIDKQRMGIMIMFASEVSSKRSKHLARISIDHFSLYPVHDPHSHPLLNIRKVHHQCHRHASPRTMASQIHLHFRCRASH